MNDSVLENSDYTHQIHPCQGSRVMAWSPHTCSVVNLPYCVHKCPLLFRAGLPINKDSSVKQYRRTKSQPSSICVNSCGESRHMMNNFKAISLAMIDSTSIVKDQILSFSRKRHGVKEIRYFGIQGLLFFVVNHPNLEYSVLE